MAVHIHDTDRSFTRHSRKAGDPGHELIEFRSSENGSSSPVMPGLVPGIQGRHSPTYARGLGLYSGEQAQWHALCGCDQRSSAAHGGTPRGPHRRLHQTIWREAPRLGREAREHRRRHPARESDQEISPPLETQSDRKPQSPMARPERRMGRIRMRRGMNFWIAGTSPAMTREEVARPVRNQGCVRVRQGRCCWIAGILGTCPRTGKPGNDE